MPYICKIREDVPDSLLQLIELKPSTSQRNAVTEPPGQTKYVRRPDNDTVVTVVGAGGALLTQRTYTGVAAWLIDNIEDTPNGDAFTAAQANTVAAAIIARMDAGLALTTAALNTTIQLTVAGSGIGLGGSTGTLTDLLEILSGAVYTLPAGSVVDTDGSTFNPVVSGTLSHVRHIVFSGAFNISRGEGRLSAWTDSAYEYGGTAGAAILLLDDDGSLL